MANKSHKVTAWGRRHADVVTCPVRGLEFQVAPGPTSTAPRHYNVNDEYGNRLGVFKWEVEGGTSSEFWNLVEHAASAK